MNLECIGEGATTKVYRDGNVAVKLYVNAPPDEAYNEADRQRFAHAAGLPVPEVYSVRELENGTALDMQYIAGKVLVQPKMDKDERRLAFERLVTLQHMVHQVDASGQPCQADRLAWKMERAPGMDMETKNRLLQRLSVLDKGKRQLCHGDFHTSNLLDDGKQIWILDWVDAACGDPFADVCRSYLIFKQYIPRMAGIYLKAYCKLVNAAPEDVLAWLPIAAAARLREKLDAKGDALVRAMVYEGL